MVQIPTQKTQKILILFIKMIYFSLNLTIKNIIIIIIIEIKNVKKVFSIIDRLFVLAANITLINLPKLSATVNKKAFSKK